MLKDTECGVLYQALESWNPRFEFHVSYLAQVTLSLGLISPSTEDGVCSSTSLKELGNLLGAMNLEISISTFSAILSGRT